jgi:hypothetical protein
MQVGQPVAHAPVALIQDPRYLTLGSTGAKVSIPEKIAIHVPVTTAPPSPGIQVLILPQEDGTYAAWGSEPLSDIMGPVIETQQQDVAEACRALRRCLRGVVLGHLCDGLVIVRLATGEEE